jgi:hypothetical protein
VDLVERVRESFDVTHREAVKIASGEKPAPDAKLFSGLQGEVAQDIVDEVDRTIRYYFATRPGLKPSGIVLFQSHVASPLIRDALKRTCGLSVFVPKGFRHLEVDSAVVSAGIQENFAPMVKAVGLALQGVNRAEVDIKVFPSELARDLRRGRVGPWVAAACLLIGILVSGMRYKSLSQDLSDARSQLGDLMATAKDRSALESSSGVDAAVKEMEAIAEVGAGRGGPLPWIEDLWQHVGAHEHAPLVVATHYDRESPGESRVILAVPLKEGSDPKKELEQFVRGLEQSAHLKQMIPLGDPWVSGEPSSEAPTKPDHRLLREQLHHQAYRVGMGGQE